MVQTLARYSTAKARYENNSVTTSTWDNETHLPWFIRLKFDYRPRYLRKVRVLKQTCVPSWLQVIRVGRRRPSHVGDDHNTNKSFLLATSHVADDHIINKSFLLVDSHVGNHHINNNFMLATTVMLAITITPKTSWLPLPVGHSPRLMPLPGPPKPPLPLDSLAAQVPDPGKPSGQATHIKACSPSPFHNIKTIKKTACSTPRKFNLTCPA